MYGPLVRPAELVKGNQIALQITMVNQPFTRRSMMDEI